MVIDFFTRRRLRKQIKEFEEILAKEEKPEIRLRLAANYRKLEQHEEAQEQYLKVAKHFIDAVELLRARAVLESLLEYYPDNEEAKKLLESLGAKPDSRPVPMLDLSTEDSGQVARRRRRRHTTQSRAVEPKEPSRPTGPSRPGSRSAVPEYTGEDETPSEEEEELGDLMDKMVEDRTDVTPVSDFSDPGRLSSSVWFEDSSVERVEIPPPPKELEEMPAGVEVFGRVLRPTDSFLIEDELVEDVFGEEEGELFENLELEEEWNKLPILKGSPAVRQALWEKSIKQRVPAGKTIFYEGDVGDSLYLLLEGRAVATRLLPNGEEEAIMEIRPGHIFGEFALISERKRYATVTAVEPSIVLEVPKAVIQSIAKSYPEFWDYIKYQYRKRLMELVIKTVPIFSSLANDALTEYLHELHLKRFTPGSALFKEGYRGGGFYLIILGKVVVKKDERALMELEEGYYIGDLSLLRKKALMVTVEAKTTTEAVYLPPKVFYQFLSDFPTIWRRVMETAKRSPLWQYHMVMGKAQELIIL